MNRALVDPIANAVLYEGYILYPYRPSTKNRQRWTFGGLYPEFYCNAHGGEAWSQQTECLVQGTPETNVEAIVRFLHLTDRQVYEAVPDAPLRPVESLRVGGTLYQSWQEAEEREVTLAGLSLGALSDRPHEVPFAFPAGGTREPLGDGALIRQRQSVAGMIKATAVLVDDGLFRLTVRVANRTPIEAPERLLPDEAQLRSLASTHVLLGVEAGTFISLMGPPERWRDAAAACCNVGAWPVLVGEEGQADAMLSAPIVLYDYPQVAPESPGDFFDGTEIDEMLTLRIMTLTDEEKGAMAAVDGRADALLARTEALAHEQLRGLHGTLRDVRPAPGKEAR